MARKKSFVPYTRRYEGSSLPNAQASRQKTQEVIDKYKSGELESKSNKKSSKPPEIKSKANLERWAKWETAVADTKEKQIRRDVDALLDKYSGHLDSPMIQGQIDGLFRRIQKYIESDEYKSAIKDLGIYDLSVAPHMNRNYVKALMYQQMLEAGDKAAQKRYIQAAFRTLRDKMLPEELTSRLGYQKSFNTLILEVMENARGFETKRDDETDEDFKDRKIAEFYRLLKDAKSKLADEYSSRDAIQAMLSGQLYDFVDENNEVNTQLLNNFIKVNTADAAAVSADIKKQTENHRQYPEAKRTSDRIKYLQNQSTKLLEIENLTPEEFNMMTGIHDYTPSIMLSMFSLFKTSGELNEAKEVIHIGTTMLEPTERFMSPYSVESYEIVKSLRDRFPDASVVELQALWRPRFIGMRNEENLAEVLKLRGD